MPIPSLCYRLALVGIRIALGAGARDLALLVMGHGLKLAVVGVLVGLAGALALTRFLSTLLFGIEPTDPLTFGCVSVLLIAIAGLACFLPALRATWVDPMVVLRYE